MRAVWFLHENMSNEAFKSCCSYRKHLHIFLFFLCFYILKHILNSLSLSDYWPPSHTNSNPSFSLSPSESSSLLLFLFLYLFIRSSTPTSRPFLLKSTWTSQNPTGHLVFSLFLTFAVPPRIHPSLPLSLIPPSPRPSVCLPYFLRWILHVSSSLNKKLLCSPEGR